MINIYRIALILVIIGSINWGFIGFFGINLVSIILANNMVLTKIVYCLVGLSGLYVAFNPLIVKIRKPEI